MTEALLHTEPLEGGLANLALRECAEIMSGDSPGQNPLWESEKDSAVRAEPEECQNHLDRRGTRNERNDGGREVAFGEAQRSGA